MEKRIRAAGLQEDSIVDGPGVRLALFTQGCPHRCPGCHNPQTHDFAGGVLMEADEILSRMEGNPLLQGITLSGGEPFAQADALYPLCRRVHAMGKDVVCFTGYTLETLLGMEDDGVRALLEEIDLLIDGPYVEAQRDLTLRFRGSANQRLIDLPKTLQSGELHLWEGES